jgi:hypothetical protein
MAEPISFQDMVNKYADDKGSAQENPLLDAGIQGYLKKNGLHLKTAVGFPEDSLHSSLLEGLTKGGYYMHQFKNFLNDKLGIKHIEGSPDHYTELIKHLGPKEGLNGGIQRYNIAKNLDFFRGFSTDLFNEFPKNAMDALWNPDKDGLQHLNHLMVNPEFRAHFINMIRQRAEMDGSKTHHHVASLAEAARGHITPQELEELSGIMSKELGQSDGLYYALQMADRKNVPEMLQAYLNHDGLDTSFLDSGIDSYGRRDSDKVHNAILDYVRNGKYKDESRRKFAIAQALAKGAAAKMTDQEFAEGLDHQAKISSYVPTESLRNFIYDGLLSENKIKAADEIFRRTVKNPDQQHEWNAAISTLPTLPLSKEAVHNVLSKRVDRVGTFDRTSPTSLGYFLKPDEVDSLIDSAERGLSANYDHNLARMLIARKVHNAYGADLTSKQQQWLDKTIGDWNKDSPSSGDVKRQREEFHVSQALRKNGLGNGYIQTPEDLLNRLDALNDRNTVSVPNIVNHPMANHDVLARLAEMDLAGKLNMYNKIEMLGSSGYEEIDRLKRLFPTTGDFETSLPNGLYGKQTHVKVGSASLRKLRDHLQENGVQLRPEELPKPEKGVAWNSIVKEIRDRHGNVNYVQDWTPLRAPNGKLSHEKVAAYIDQMPTREFAVVDDRAWNHDLQNHSKAPTNVMSVNLTANMAQRLKDSDLWDEFVDLAVADQHLAHPTSNHTIGWTRYSVDHKNKAVFIDECQSDLLGNYRKRMADANLPEKKKTKYKKVWDMVFGKDHPSEIVSETAHQYFRDSNMHDYAVSTHTVDSKRGISIDEDPDKPAPAHMNETYKNIPKKMGMESGKYGDRAIETGDGDYELQGKPVHIGQIRKSEDPNETFPEFMREYVKLNPEAMQNNPSSALRMAVTKYLIDHQDGREITFKDYEDILREYKEPIEAHRRDMDLEEDLMNRKIMRSMAVPSGWATSDYPSVHGSTELINHILNGQLERGMPSAVDVGGLIPYAKLTPELVEKVLHISKLTNSDLHNTLLAHRDTKGKDNLANYETVIKGIMKGRSLAGDLKNSKGDKGTNDAQRMWVEVLGDLMNREAEASPTEKGKLRSLISGITKDVDYSDKFFSDPEVTGGYPDEIRGQLIQSSDKTQLNKYLDGVIARENAGEKIADPSNIYGFTSHPQLGVNELLKMDNFKSYSHVLPTILRAMGEQKVREAFNGKLSAEKVAEMAKRRMPYRPGDGTGYESDDFETVAHLADFTPYGGKVPEWFPRRDEGEFKNNARSVSQMARSNPTYRIPKEAIGTVFRSGAFPNYNVLIEQSSPELKAELAKMAQVVIKHNNEYKRKFGGPPGFSYGNTATKPSNLEFIKDMDALAKENGLQDAGTLMGTAHTDSNKLHRQLFSVIQDSHPEEAAKLAESVSGGLSFFQNHMSITDDKGRPVGEINPKVFGHIKHEGLLHDLDSEDILDPSAEGLEPDLLKRLQDVHEQEYAGYLGQFRDGVYVPHYGMGGQDTNALIYAARSGNLDDFYKRAGAFADVAMVKRNSEPLRYLRDYLEQMQKDGKDPVIDPKELPKDKTFNSITSSVKTKNKDGSETESRVLDWTPLRDPKKGGKVTLQSVQNYIDSMSETRFNISHTVWHGAQRHNNEDSNVMVVGLTDDHVRKIKEAGLWPTLSRLSSELPTSHPQHPMALGWIRYTGTGHDISHGNKRIIEAQPDTSVFTDEIQSDLMKGISKLKPEKAKKLSEILFGGTHPSELLHEVFQEMARKSGLVGKIMRIHSSESKAPISLARNNDPVPVHFGRTYEDFPKKRLNAEPSTYGHPDFPSEDHAGPNGSPETKKLKDKRIWQGVFRKSEEYSDWDDA